MCGSGAWLRRKVKIIVGTIIAFIVGTIIALIQNLPNEVATDENQEVELQATNSFNSCVIS